MSNVIPFPDERSKNVMVTCPPITWGECTEVIHYFDETPGVCHCGKNFWEPPNDPVERPRGDLHEA